MPNGEIKESWFTIIAKFSTVQIPLPNCQNAKPPTGERMAMQQRSAPFPKDVKSFPFSFNH